MSSLFECIEKSMPVYATHVEGKKGRERESREYPAEGYQYQRGTSTIAQWGNNRGIMTLYGGAYCSATFLSLSFFVLLGNERERGGGDRAVR